MFIEYSLCNLLKNACQHKNYTYICNYYKIN